MSVTVILEADVKLGKKQQLLQLLITYLPETRKYKGFVDISIYSEAESKLVIFLSKWQSVEAYQQYLQWRTDTGVMDLLANLLESTPKIRFLNKEISDNLTLINN